jgi:hypothetical protein
MIQFASVAAIGLPLAGTIAATTCPLQGNVVVAPLLS